MANWTRVENQGFIDIDKATFITIVLANPESQEGFRIIITVDGEDFFTPEYYASGQDAYNDILKLINITVWRDSEEN